MGIYFSHTMMILTSEDSEEIKVLPTRSLSNLLGYTSISLTDFTLNDRFFCAVRWVLFDSVYGR